jgi:hypothetical protein
MKVKRMGTKPRRTQNKGKSRRGKRFVWTEMLKLSVVLWVMILLGSGDSKFILNERPISVDF